MVLDLADVKNLTESEQALILAAKRLHSIGKPRYTGYELAVAVRDYCEDSSLMKVTTLGRSLGSLTRQGHLAAVQFGTKGYNPHVKLYQLT